MTDNEYGISIGARRSPCNSKNISSTPILYTITGVMYFRTSWGARGRPYVLGTPMGINFPTVQVELNYAFVLGFPENANLKVV